MRIVVIESDSACARLSPADAEMWERNVAEILAGTRQPILMLPPGRHLRVVEVPADAPAPVKAQPPRQKEFKA